MTGSAGVSVVVPTRNSNDTVPDLLRSIDRARAELGVPSEVIVVDDSGRAQRAELERLCGLHDARLVSGGPHVGAKRNLGAAAARFDLLLFIDSDCEASPELLREHWETCTAAGADACAGPVEFAGPRSWLWAGLDYQGTTAAFRAPATRPRVPWAVTANLSVRRCRFEEIGGFDETMPGPLGGEDVDLGLRLTGRGFEIHGNPRALVRHSTSTWNSPRALLRRFARYGRSEVPLVERHPGYTYTAFPGHLTLLAAGAALWLAIGLVGRGGPDPLLAPLWAVAYVCAWLGRALRFGWPDPRTLQALTGALLIGLAYEAGQLAACARLGRPGWWLRRLGVDERQAPAEWAAGSTRAWCWTAATALCTVVWIATAR
jgi:glycosyltransferase involved in cell wall biosynthesis